MGRALGLVVLVLLSVTACGGGADDEAVTTTTSSSSSTSTTADAATTTTTTGPTTTSTTTTTAAGLAQTCTNPDAGYSVGYPAGWSTNDGDVSPPCSYFHPEPFEVPEATEVLGLAVILRIESVPFETVSAPDSLGERELSRTETTVAGRPAVRVEAEATGEALLPEGIPVYRYAVDLGGETFVGATYGVEGLDFDANSDVLDAMMESLELDAS